MGILLELKKGFYLLLGIDLSQNMVRPLPLKCGFSVGSTALLQHTRAKNELKMNSIGFQPKIRNIPLLWMTSNFL